MTGIWLTLFRASVEIILLAVGIYYALNLIRGSRGAPVAYGLAVVLLGMEGLAALMRLEVLAWLLGKFFAFSAIAVVVLFQPELRRILARLGTQSMLTPVKQQRDTIEIIIDTVERLAEVKIGALIAVERTVPLQDAVSSGVNIDCAATPEMFETLFFPNNAVHDGGVILAGDRISRAACVFPLTRRSDLSPSLGTRHRAAIGLTEETDAIVVVVSEETGGISYASEGRLIRGVTLEQLRAFLTSALLMRSKPRTAVEWIRSTLIQRSQNRDAKAD
jgi:diadenylate cyclase